MGVWGLPNGGENELTNQTKPILALSEEMEKLSSRIWEDVTSTLVSLSGSLKDIECGTHIKIPMGAGYVSYSKSHESSETISLWIRETIQRD